MPLGPKIAVLPRPKMLPSLIVPKHHSSTYSDRDFRASSYTMDHVRICMNKSSTLRFPNEKSATCSRIQRPLSGLKGLGRNRTRNHTSRIGLAWLGLAWPGLAWLGLPWLGVAWNGLAWLGLTSLRLVRGPYGAGRRIVIPRCSAAPLGGFGHLR